MKNLIILLLSIFSIWLLWYWSAYETVLNKIDSNVYRTWASSSNRCSRKEYSRDNWTLGIWFLWQNQKFWKGLTIDSIVPNSPAASKWLKEGDEILELNWVSLVNNLSGYNKVKYFTDNYWKSTWILLTYVSWWIKKSETLNRVNIINQIFVCQKYELNDEDNTITSNIHSSITKKISEDNNKTKTTFSNTLQEIKFLQRSSRVVTIAREIQKKLSQ